MDCPVQMEVVPAMEMENPAFDVMVILASSVQPLEAVTVTVYVPGAITEMPDKVEPLLHM